MIGGDIDALFALLAQHPKEHASDTALFRFMSCACESLFRASPLAEATPIPIAFGPFGEIAFPYRSMGAVDSIDLFGLHELILFAFYDVNRGRYRACVDIGANLGLHTILMARCGFHVRAFEPDPVHAELLSANLARNGIGGVELVRAAVSDVAGEAEFVRVKGNTTGSHIAGAKSDPYGDLDRFAVQLQTFAAAVEGADFVKIDAEGHEVVLVRSLPEARWDTLDAVVEIGTRDNAAEILAYFAATGVKLFSQRIGWRAATTVDDLPHSHRDGSVFVSRKHAMPWRTL